MLHIVGDITDKTFKKVAKYLDKHQDQDEILIILNSQGGSSYAALGIYDMIRASATPVHVYAFGACMSAATIILAGAHKRYIGSSTTVMIHDSDGNHSGSRAELEQSENEEWVWAKLFEKHSHTPSEDWRAMSKKETYLTATEALQLGIVDVVLKGNNV